MDNSADQRIVIGAGRTTQTSVLLAAIAAMTGMGFKAPRIPRVRVTHTPMMVTSSDAEIAAWNRAVDQRKAARNARRA